MKNFINKSFIPIYVKQDNLDLFNDFIEIWLDNPATYMFGVPIQKLDSIKNIKNLPEGLKILPKLNSNLLYHNHKSRLLLQIDTKYFNYLFRGITGDNLNEIIKTYSKLGKLTNGNCVNHISFSKNPLVSLSGDMGRPYTSTDGVIFVIDNAKVNAIKDWHDMIDEFHCDFVPLDSIVATYSHLDNQELIKKICNNVQTHSWNKNQEKEFKKNIALRLINDMLENSESFMCSDKYKTVEEAKLFSKGLKYYQELTELIENLVYSNPKKNNQIRMHGGRYKLNKEHNCNAWISTQNLNLFKESIFNYIIEIRKKLNDYDLPDNLKSLNELSDLINKEDESMYINNIGMYSERPITKQEILIYQGVNVTSELHKLFFG